MTMHDFFATHKVLLAPMAGISDKAFRYLCCEQGADLAYTEMVSAMGLSFANVKTRHLLDLCDHERQVAVQLFGHDPKILASQAAWVEDTLEKRLAYIDINMGCPAKKIVTKGDGCALMKTPDLACAIVEEVTRAISHPLTCKFRRGWSAEKESAPDFARRLEQAGAAALAIHGRYAQQMYQGSADREVIKRVKDAVSIPVIGNGDVASASDAKDMLEQTGCNAVMIARAARGNPWIFSSIKAVFAKRLPSHIPSSKEKILMAYRHAHLLADNPHCRIVQFRKHAAWYIKGLKDACALRAQIMRCSTLKDFDTLFYQLLNREDTDVA